MKGKLFTIMALGILFSSVGFISAANVQETSTIIVSIYPQEVSISVPDEILFPDLAPGYISPEVGFNIINDGTEDITISGSIAYDDDIITANRLLLKKNLVDNLTMSEEFSFEILKPTLVGGTRTEKIFAVFDLTDVNADFSEPLINQTHDLTFTAMAFNY